MKPRATARGFPGPLLVVLLEQTRLAQVSREPRSCVWEQRRTTSGGCCVIETWESPEALQDFYEHKLRAALEAAGIQGQPRIFEIVNSVT